MNNYELDCATEHEVLVKHWFFMAISTKGAISWSDYLELSDETRHIILKTCAEHNERENDAMQGKKSIESRTNYHGVQMKEI